MNLQGEFVEVRQPIPSLSAEHGINGTMDKEIVGDGGEQSGSMRPA